MSRSGVLKAVIAVLVVVGAVVGALVYYLGPVRPYFELTEDRYKVDMNECTSLPISGVRFALFSEDGTPLTTGVLEANGSITWPDGFGNPGHCLITPAHGTEIPRYRKAEKYLVSIEGSERFEVWDHGVTNNLSTVLG